MEIVNFKWIKIQVIYIHTLMHNQNTQLSLKAVSVHYYILLHYTLLNIIIHYYTLYIIHYYTFRTLKLC